MSKKNIVSSMLKGAAKASLKGNANSTTCGIIFQPQAPAELKKFSKLNK